MRTKMKDDTQARYEEDARILIKKLADNKIHLKNGELNYLGVQILIETAYAILGKESVAEAIAKVEKK